MKLCLAFLAATMVFFGILDISAQDDAVQRTESDAREDESIRIQTELMEVRAVVTDRDGRIVEDLKKEDFELLENDQPQEISFFTVSQIERERSKI